MNDSHVSFTLPTHKLQQLWILASQKDVPLAKVIREAIDNYLSKSEEPVAKADNIISLPAKTKATNISPKKKAAKKKKK